MELPNPLPLVLPIGTIIKYNNILLKSLTIGTFDSEKNLYYFDSLIDQSIDLVTSRRGYFPNRIVWDQLPSSDLKKCKWCLKPIADGIVCISSENDCELYWNTLSDRLKLDFRNPEDALEYDRLSVKKFVDNRKKHNV